MRKITGGLSTIVFFVFWAAVASALDNTAVKVTSLLMSTTTWDGQQISYPEGQAEVTALLVEIAPGETTGWHYHPVPSFAFVFEGVLEITLADGRVKRLEAGEALAEVTKHQTYRPRREPAPRKACRVLCGSGWKNLDNQ